MEATQAASPTEASSFDDSSSFIASLPDVRTAARHLGTLRLSQSRLLEAFRTSVSVSASQERQMRHGDALAAQLAKSRAENYRLADHIARLNEELALVSKQQTNTKSPSLSNDIGTQSVFENDNGNSNELDVVAKNIDESIQTSLDTFQLTVASKPEPSTRKHVVSVVPLVQKSSETETKIEQLGCQNTSAKAIRELGVVTVVTEKQRLDNPMLLQELAVRHRERNVKLRGQCKVLEDMLVVSKQLLQDERNLREQDNKTLASKQSVEYNTVALRLEGEQNTRAQLENKLTHSNIECNKLKQMLEVVSEQQNSLACEWEKERQNHEQMNANAVVDREAALKLKEKCYMLESEVSAAQTTLETSDKELQSCRDQLNSTAGQLGIQLKQTIELEKLVSQLQHSIRFEKSRAEVAEAKFDSSVQQLGEVTEQEQQRTAQVLHLDVLLGEAGEKIEKLEEALYISKQSKPSKGAFHVFVETKEENQRLQSRVELLERARSTPNTVSAVLGYPSKSMKSTKPRTRRGQVVNMGALPSSSSSSIPSQHQPQQQQQHVTNQQVTNQHAGRNVRVVHRMYSQGSVSGRRASSGNNHMSTSIERGGNSNKPSMRNSFSSKVVPHHV